MKHLMPPVSHRFLAKSLLCTTLLFSLLLPTFCWGYVGDILNILPTADYRTTITEHFEVIYPRALESMADESSKILEEVHTLLTPIFQFEPKRRTVIVLTDNSDSANGITSALGHQGIMLFMAAPDPYTSIGEYDHWLRNLIVHEYTHYLTLAPTRGIFTALSYLLGDLILPNHLWPTYLAEGMAVYAETAFTHRGRGHGTYHDTIIRHGLAKEKLNSGYLDYEQFIGPLPDFPFGEGPYLAGYGIIEQMMHEVGEKSPAVFATRSSGRLPFFLDSTLQETAFTLDLDEKKAESLSFSGLWDRWLDRQAKRWQADIDQLKNDPLLPQIKYHSAEKASALGSRLSPDERFLAYTFRSGHENGSLQVKDLTTGGMSRLEKLAAQPGLSWSADSKTLYFSATEYVGPYNTWSDLYSWNPQEKSLQRLTHGARSKDPTLCTFAGKEGLVYTSVEEGISKLKLFIINNETKYAPLTLLTAPLHYHYSNPRCEIKTGKIYFSTHSMEPFDEIEMLDLEKTNIVANLSSDSSAGTSSGESLKRGDLEEQRPVHIVGGSSDGFAALFAEPRGADLFFTRVHDGYYDLALLRQEKLFTLAHSLGGYWFASVGATRVAATYFSSEGFQAVELPMPTAVAVSERAPEKTSETLPLKSTEALQGQTPIPPTLSFKKGQYRLYRSLAPRIWGPYMVLSSSHNQFGGTILGWDDIDQLNYTLNAWYDSRKKGPGGMLTTSHRFAGLRISPFLENSQSGYSEEYKWGAQISRPIPKLYSTVEPFAMVQWARSRNLNTLARSFYDPQIDADLGLVYDSRTQTGYSVEHEAGFTGLARGRRIFSIAHATEDSWKFLIHASAATPAWPQHATAQVNAYFAGAPSPRSSIPASMVDPGGQGSAGDLDPPLRGFAQGSNRGRRATIVQAQYTVPTGQIFRGIGNFPLFIRNHAVFAFSDLAKIQKNIDDTIFDTTPVLASIGGGLILNTNIAYSLPFSMRLSLAHGLNTSRGGENEIFIGIGL